MGTKTVELTCFYFGVGQGLFTAGLLEESDGPNSFAWVYDCGYSTKIEAPLVDHGINTLGRRTKKSSGDGDPKPVIDLLVISHFDRDHIAGVTTLLRKFRVEKVLLPFSSLAQRVIAAFDQHKELSEAELRYFVNPVQFLAGIEGSDIGEIVVVPPSDPGERPPPPNRDQPAPDGHGRLIC
jgi:glyoxylase-like metal-dependent hydrolase (beta-lactamase superfamily II)